MTDWNLLANMITAGAIIATAAVAYYELRELQKQQHIEVFTKYTERYSEIVDNLKDAVYTYRNTSALMSSMDDAKEYEKLNHI